MNSQSAAIRAITDGELILATADIAASPHRIFRAFTVPQEIERWWGAADVYLMRQWVQDLRPGGLYTVNVLRPDGNIFPASGRFLEIDAPHKLSHTRKYEWDFPVLGRRETIITYLFDSLPDGTRITVRHEGFTGCRDAAYEHAAGWERVLRWLDMYLMH